MEPLQLCLILEPGVDANTLDFSAGVRTGVLIFTERCYGGPVGRYCNTWPSYLCNECSLAPAGSPPRSGWLETLFMGMLAHLSDHVKAGHQIWIAKGKPDAGTRFVRADLLTIHMMWQHLGLCRKPIPWLTPEDVDSARPPKGHHRHA